jgi:hypothetical protein
VHQVGFIYKIIQGCMVNKTLKKWKNTQAKTKLTTHCMNKSNEEIKTRHTPVLEKLIIIYCSPKVWISYRTFINTNICTPTQIFTHLFTLEHWPCHINVTSRFCYHINKLQYVLWYCSMCLLSILTLSQSGILISPNSYTGFLPSITTNHSQIKI